MEQHAELHAILCEASQGLNFSREQLLDALAALVEPRGRPLNDPAERDDDDDQRYASPRQRLAAVQN